MNTLKKTTVFFLLPMMFLYTVASMSLAFDLNEYEFTVTIDADIYENSVDFPYSLSLMENDTSGAKVTLVNNPKTALRVISGYSSSLGLDLDNETVQEGFLLLDGTLALSISEIGTSEGRAGIPIRTGYSMVVNQEALKENNLTSIIRTQLGQDFESYPRRARLADARLMRFSENEGTWVRAVRSIRTQDIKIENRGNSSPDGVLGHYGYNETESYVWAVLDSNSKYAVGINIDHDNDGFYNPKDNCPYVFNTDQLDTDVDLVGDACDDDDDNDGVDDVADNCPLEANSSQFDFDGNGIGDICDADSDGDGVIDGLDICQDTAAIALVGPEGCSLDDICLCSNAWKNHGAYVRCIARASNYFIELGLIDEFEKDTVVSNAASSFCGHK